MYCTKCRFMPYNEFTSSEAPTSPTPAVVDPIRLAAAARRRVNLGSSSSSSQDTRFAIQRLPGPDRAGRPVLGCLYECDGFPLWKPLDTTTTKNPMLLRCNPLDLAFSGRGLSASFCLSLFRALSSVPLFCVDFFHSGMMEDSKPVVNVVSAAPTPAAVVSTPSGPPADADAATISSFVRAMCPPSKLGHPANERILKSIAKKAVLAWKSSAVSCLASFLNKERGALHATVLKHVKP
jgi:hypothetical protein